MKKVLFVVLMLFAAQGLFAGLLDICGNGATFTSLNTIGGCVNGDKFYTNFAVTGTATDLVAQFADNGTSHLITVQPQNGYFTGSTTFAYDVTVLVQNQCAGAPCPVANPWVVVYAGLYGAPAIDQVGTVGDGTAVKSFSGVAGSMQWDYPGPTVLKNVGLANFRVSDTVTGTGLGLTSVTNQYVEGQANIPEPATMALFGSGLLALGLIRRFRRS